MTTCDTADVVEQLWPCDNYNLHARNSKYPLFCDSVSLRLSMCWVSRIHCCHGFTVDIRRGFTVDNQHVTGIVWGGNIREEPTRSTDPALLLCPSCNRPSSRCCPAGNNDIALYHFWVGLSLTYTELDKIRVVISIRCCIYNLLDSIISGMYLLSAC